MTRTMKDSGIEWIGEIPEDWSISKVKHCFTRKNSKAKQDDPVVLSLARSGVKIRDISTNEGQLAESYYDYNPVRVGDLLLNPMDLYSGANCSYSDVEGVISPAYINLKNKEGVSNSKFYDYYFKVQYWMMVLFSFGKGVSFDNRWTLGQETLMNFPIVYPLLSEQQKIADFLDEKCSHIDSILEKTKASIDECKQLKQSVITQAVTKGIRPNRPMKDSGIEWIGQIPEDWEVRKIKSLGQYRNGLTYAPEDMCEEFNGTLVLRSSNVKQGKISYGDNIYVSTTIPKQLYVRKGDILVCSRNGSRDLIGKNAIIKDDITASFGAFMMIYRCDTPEYMYYILNSHIFNYYLGSFLTSTINQLTGKNFGSMNVVYCSNTTEQQEIVSYLDDKCSEIDRLITKKEQLIEELETYKKSLIYEYVTGKKEVV